MKLTEYKDARRMLDISYENSQQNLKIKFAESNNPVKVGDLISDAYKYILVKMFYVATSFDEIPFMVYEGVRMKEDGTPLMDDDIYNNRVSQTQMRTINGKDYTYNPHLFGYEKEV